MGNSQAGCIFTWEDSLFRIVIVALNIDEARAKGNKQLTPIQYSLITSAPREVVIIQDDPATVALRDVRVFEK